MILGGMATVGPLDEEVDVVSMTAYEIKQLIQNMTIHFNERRLNINTLSLLDTFNNIKHDVEADSELVVNLNKAFTKYLIHVRNLVTIFLDLPNRPPDIGEEAGRVALLLDVFFDTRSFSLFQHELSIRPHGIQIFEDF